MRYAGRILDWNDDRGFGFVVPNGGGTRAFVHVRAFAPGSRRPVDGDLISYSVTRDRQGRATATGVRFAGQGGVRPTAARGVPRVAIALAFLAAAGLGTAAGLVPFAMLGAYLGASLVSYLLYGLDKAAAGRSLRRIPESTLHLVDALGGWPGALIAQQQFRHKTMKTSFRAFFRIIVAVNLALAWWLLHSGTALTPAGP